MPLTVAENQTPACNRVLGYSIRTMTKCHQTKDGQADTGARIDTLILLLFPNAKWIFKGPFYPAVHSAFAWVNIMLDHSKQNVSCVSSLPASSSVGYWRVVRSSSPYCAFLGLFNYRSLKAQKTNKQGYWLSFTVSPFVFAGISRKTKFESISF